MLEHQYSKAMHAECKRKEKKNTNIYPGAKQEAAPISTSSSIASILVYFINHPYAKVYSRPRQLGDTYGGPHKSSVVRQVPPGTVHLT